MRRYNVVGVLSPDGESWLLCLRAKPPYQGKYNLVGGKIEPGAFRRAIESGSRLDLGVTAPAHGLTLMEVFYTLEEENRK